MKIVVIKKKTAIVTAVILAAACVLTAVAFGLNPTATFSRSAERKLPIYCVKTDEKKVAISFDCAWGADYTDALLSTMNERGVKSTFFTVQFWAEKYPEYVKKISDFGHEIGTHSATHPYMSKLSKAAIESELNSSSRAIEEITGKKVTLFRPPYGDYNDLLIQTAEDLGLYVIQWDVDSLDWKDLTAAEITARVLKRVKSGSIVLFHNNAKHTHEAIGGIIDALKGQGYEFVTVGQLIYKDGYKMLADGTQAPEKPNK